MAIVKSLPLQVGFNHILVRGMVPTSRVSQPSYPRGLSFCLILVIRKSKRRMLEDTASQSEGRKLRVYSWLFIPPTRPTAMAPHLLRVFGTYSIGCTMAKVFIQEGPQSDGDNLSRKLESQLNS